MSSLSSYIINPATQKELKRLRFLDLYKSEKDLDKLVIEQCKLLADLLIENKLLQPGSELKFIGAQFQHVDLLFAEVDEDEEQNLHRLVLVEDKLLKNPEAKRSVIGQIIDYAAGFSSVRVGTLAANFPELQQWIVDNADLLDSQLKRGDFLLVVCGDSIHSNVADIIRRLALGADRHPTRGGMELCLVAMGLFGDDTQHYLIPHLVGRVIEATRHFRITVQNTQGVALPTTVEIQEPIHNEQTKKSSTNPSSEGFFAKMWAQKFGQKPVDDCKQFLETIKDANIPGLSMVPSSSGKPRLQLQSTLLGGRMVPILHVRGKQPAIIDDMKARIWEDATAARARTDFRKELLAIGGTSTIATDQVMIPTKVLNAATGDVIKALHRLSESLKGA